jgi:hypothetical protein
LNSIQATTISTLGDRTNRFITHLSDRCKTTLDPSSQLGDTVITPLLSLESISTSLQIRLPRLAGISTVSVNVRAGVGLVEHGLKMLTIVNWNGIGFDPADQL